MDAKKIAIAVGTALLTAIAAAVILDAMKRRGFDPVGKLSTLLSPAQSAPEAP